MKKKFMKIFSVLLVCLSFMSANAFAGTWVQNNKGETFYKDDNGNYQYGWIQNQGQWRYVSVWSGLHKDWLYDKNYNTYYHFNAMGIMDGQTPYLEQTDESIHSGWTKIDATYKDSVIFFCQKGINGTMYNIYYPSTTNQADFLNGNVSYIYSYNTITGELQKVVVKG